MVAGHNTVITEFFRGLADSARPIDLAQRRAATHV